MSLSHYAFIHFEAVVGHAGTCTHRPPPALATAFSCAVEEPVDVDVGWGASILTLACKL
eukprot:COSAG02_NODE_693_length_18428_cov_268.516722_16_plen_58_part_01